MEQSLDVMTIALRVLRAVNKKLQPDQVDIDALCAYAGTPPADISPDQLACDVIQKALKQRALARAARGMK